MPEDSVKQVLINSRLVGIVGLEKALTRAYTKCTGKSDAEISDFLIHAVSDHNDVSATARDAYAKALLRQWIIEAYTTYTN